MLFGHGACNVEPAGQYAPTRVHAALLDMDEQKLPAGQTAATLEPDGQNEPGTQMPEHVDVVYPLVLPYAPAAHGKHAVVFEKYPALQVTWYVMVTVSGV